MILKKVKMQINNDPSNDLLVTQLESLEADLNTILDFETQKV